MDGTGGAEALQPAERRYESPPKIRIAIELTRSSMREERSMSK